MATIKGNCNVIPTTGFVKKCQPNKIVNDNYLNKELLIKRQRQLEALRDLHPYFHKFNYIKSELDKKAYRVLF